MPSRHMLNTLEREAFDSPPMFTSLQRRQHFDFPAEILQIAGRFRTPATQVCFLVSSGYFKATLRRHRNLVRHFYGFRTYDQEAGHVIGYSRDMRKNRT